MNLKKLMIGLVTIVALGAEARIVRIVGEGTGGTTTGDKPAACGRAYDRAERDADRKCDRRDGDVLDFQDGNCHCRKVSGSRDDYNCDATVTASCSI
ncbi:MAG: hypothetical protein R3A80_01605 [Bdellovibrionota bacterium]